MLEVKIKGIKRLRWVLGRWQSLCRRHFSAGLPRGKSACEAPRKGDRG